MVLGIMTHQHSITNDRFSFLSEARDYITDVKSQGCAIWGNHKEIPQFRNLCSHEEYTLTPPSWENIIHLDVKCHIGTFYNAEICTYIEQFLCNSQEHKVLHLDFFSYDIRTKETIPVFYKTRDWKRIVKILNTYEVVGNVELEVVMQFVAGHDIELIKVQSYDFIIKCWNIIQNEINFGKFSVICYIHDLDHYGKVLPTMRISPHPKSNLHYKIVFKNNDVHGPIEVYN
jgi:hypothetical protein